VGANNHYRGFLSKSHIGLNHKQECFNCYVQNMGKKILLTDNKKSSLIITIGDFKLLILLSIASPIPITLHCKIKNPIVSIHNYQVC
jgi:hypothetical protein